MGSFSWLDCCTREQVVNGKTRDVYLLVPQEYAGAYGNRITEHCYDGYGNFGGYDVYDLIPKWNREQIPDIVSAIRAGMWHCHIRSGKDLDDLMHFYHGQPISCELRWLGIVMACYDEDNSRLKYPIKITYNPDAVYEDYRPSKNDPEQGFPPGSGYFDEWTDTTDDDDEEYYD